MDECDTASADAGFTIVPAPTGLREVVERVWVARAGRDDAAPPESVVPDGCVELVFNLGDPFERQVARGTEPQPLALVVGQMTSAVTVRPTGRVDLLGVRLRADRATAWLRVPAWELRDQLVPAATLLGPEAQRLHDALGEATSTAARLAALARLCGEWSRPDRRPVDPPIAWAVGDVRRTKGLRAIGALARAAGLDRRRLERGFRRWVGLTPKEFARITRVQHALALFDRHPRPTGAAVAAACGYADQSHLIREFRALVGPAPGAAATHGLAALLRSTPGHALEA